jgi:hypothetical protein
MGKEKLFRHHVAGVMFGALSLAAVVPAAAANELSGANSFDGQWHFNLTPYAWLPTIYNSASFTGPFGISGGVDSAMHTTPNDYLDDLSFAFMIAGEARKGDWSVFTDYIYMKLKGQDTSVRTVRGPGGAVLPVADLGATLDLKSDVWTLAGSYTAWRRGGLSSRRLCRHALPVHEPDARLEHQRCGRPAPGAPARAFGEHEQVGCDRWRERGGEPQRR